MDNGDGGGTRGNPGEELVLRTVAAHAESLLRTARRFSICPDDAQDAYQRALEIFMEHAGRLAPDQAAGWLHVVVRREAQAIRRSRQASVSTTELNLDQREARSLPTPDEQVESLDLIGRSAEALKRLKPHELRALWLKAQGHSYSEIAAITGWSYTKVNRCLSEGRQSFLERYASIESGAECEQWQPVISAMVDGEATAEQLIDVRPHLRNCAGCRATLRTLQDSAGPLSAVFPIPLAVAASESSDATSILTHLYEVIATSLHDRAATSVVKVQALVEATSAGKAAAIASATVAVAGGGYATVERAVERRPVVSQTSTKKVTAPAQPSSTAAAAPPVRRVEPARRSVTPTVSQRTEFAPSAPTSRQAPEFSRQATSPTAASAGPSGASKSQSAPGTSSKQAPSAPEFASKTSNPEFGP